MDYSLPFPIEIVFLLIVLPIAFAYLASVAGVLWLGLRKAWKKLSSRGKASSATHPPMGP
jgi:hypothetical protein